MKKIILSALAVVITIFMFSSFKPTNKSESNDDLISQLVTKITCRWTDKKMKIENIPIYKIQVTNVENVDGSITQCAFLVDEKGNKRSPETVKTINNAIKASCVSILKQLWTDYISLSKSKNKKKNKIDLTIYEEEINFIKKAISQKNKEKKMLKEYEKNFTAVGSPKAANVDLSSYPLEDKTLTNAEYIALQDKFKNREDLDEAIDDFFED